jgi:hypothetical protein
MGPLQSIPKIVPASANSPDVVTLRAPEGGETKLDRIASKDRVISDPDIFRAAKLLIDQRGNRSRFDLNRDARRDRRGRTLAGAPAALTLSGSPPHQA